MDKKINQLAEATFEEAADPAWLFVIAEPVTGIAKKMTNARHKLTTGVQKHKYVADGTEGTSLTLPVLSGKAILLAGREGGIIYEVESSPDPAEFMWDLTTVELGAQTNTGERFIFLYVI